MLYFYQMAAIGRMKCLLCVLVALVVADGVLTEFLLNRGLAYEGNPFMKPLVGDISFMFVKIGGSLLCAFILWDIYRHWPRLAMIATRVFVVAYGLIVVWNFSLLALA